MKSSRYISIIIAALVCCNVFAVRQGPQTPPPAPEPGIQDSQQEEQEKTIIDIKGRRMFPIELGPDSSAVSLVGNVIAYHNGTVITCDSAVRFSDRRIECFGNVLINKDSTYVYGDRADYDGDRNIARVFSPIIKMIDGESVLYTYNFLFDTKANVGEYYGGGTMVRNGTLLESDRGFYYGDTKDVICVGDVELRDSTYQITSDSLGYNMNTEIATFFSHTYIWNEKGEILSANKGWYYTRDDHYHFTSNAFVLTDNQEIWADDMNYWSTVEDVVMRSNIQIRDEDQKVLAFGDYGIYFGETGNAMLTEEPSLISFREENGDSLYMRSDSIFMYVLDSTSIYSHDYVGNKIKAASDEEMLEEEIIDPVGDALRNQQMELGNMITNAEQQLENGEAVSPSGVEGATAPMAPVASAVEAPDTLSLQGQRVQEPSGEPTADELSLAEDQRLVEAPQADKPLTKQELKAQRKAAKRKLREEKRAAREASRRSTQGARATEGEGTTEESQSLPEEDDAQPGDEESMLTDAEAEAQASEDQEKERVIVGYRNVKIYRTDFQGVCDSLLAFSIDTTIHMHIDPVLWNADNQIKSELAVIYMKNDELDKAVFSGGNPIMSAELDKWHYNQVTGKVIEAYFRDNDMYRTDAIGNGQTYYYLQDEETKEYQGFLVAECSDITFYITKQMLESIVYRVNPVYAIYPMDRIPGTQEQILPNFVWEGHRKPSKEEVFDREIRPSQREEYVALPLPQYPLTAKINTRKLELIQSGVWQDRSEDISDEAREFMELIENRQVPTVVQ